jgi:hypothetical protein
LLTAFARGARHRVFFEKIENIFADGLCQGLSAQVFFQKKNKNPPLCRRPSLEAVGKEGFKKPSI